jgi:hypothetical protein
MLWISRSGLSSAGAIAAKTQNISGRFIPGNYGMTASAPGYTKTEMHDEAKKTPVALGSVGPINPLVQGHSLQREVDIARIRTRTDLGVSASLTILY